MQHISTGLSAVLFRSYGTKLLQAEGAGWHRVLQSLSNHKANGTSLYTLWLTVNNLTELWVSLCAGKCELLHRDADSDIWEPDKEEFRKVCQLVAWGHPFACMHAYKTAISVSQPS